MFARAAWVVFRFECRAALRFTRLALMAGLALFPTVLIAILRFQGAPIHEHAEPVYVGLFVLVPEVVCLLSLLLWATPVVQTEVERKTWTYLAVRPGGRAPVLLGKYAAAFAFSLVTGIVALSLAMLAVGPVQDLRFGPTWAFFAGLVALSCLAYAALYVLLGVIFVRRAMAVAVAYTFVFEFLVGFIPAMINQLTVQHHLRSLLLNWLGPSRETLEIRAVLGAGPSWQHVAALLTLTAALLVASTAVLNRRELVTITEI